MIHTNEAETRAPPYRGSTAPREYEPTPEILSADAHESAPVRLRHGPLEATLSAPMHLHRAPPLYFCARLLLACLVAPACFYNPIGSEATETVSAETGDSPTTEPPLECNNDGTCDPGETEQNCMADCFGPPRCGDGVRNADEACDDGAANSNDYSTEPHCNADCSALAPHCGDTSCEPGKEDGNSCTMDCKPACGNGIKEPGETCDYGKDTLTCDADCTAVECGDIHVNSAQGETCDDGNAATDDACVMCQAATCGDGFVQKGVEPCDDGNDINDDACSNACQLPRRVFVTSLSYTGKLFGLDAADQTCQVIAIAAMLKGNFRAWLSDDTGSPTSRFDSSFTGSYQLLDGTVVASDGWMDLIDGTLAHAIDLDEKQKKTETSVWTNTLLDGTSASTSDHCNNWSTSGTTTTMVGDSKGVDKTWTELAAGQFCKDPRRLFCFEDP